MGRPPIQRAMTPTERQRKWRWKVAREKKLANPLLRAKQRRSEHERLTAAKIAASKKVRRYLCGS